MENEAKLSEFYLELRGKLARSGRPLVLVGLMGAGKTAVGFKLASRLNMPIIDSDREIEESARMPISDIFAKYGEVEFRALEKRVILRILETPDQIISTGGGALTTEECRTAIKKLAISVWLRVDLDEIERRVARKNNRPLMETPDRRQKIEQLHREREPFYAAADIIIDSLESSDSTTNALMDRLDLYLSQDPS
ncbi:MAG: shikimate kinase [Candidatus Pacebacteria bacterium]|nr:shikimate kinase [Candidatus Paceibacterota bacterium]